MLLEVFFLFEKEPMAFFELKSQFPVLFKATDTLFSMLESVWVCPGCFSALYIIRNRNRLTDVSFYQPLRSPAADV